MLQTLHKTKTIHYGIGLILGFLFGFLLQKGGVCDYEIILGQLLLEDFTVIKVILTAIITGMLGVYAMREFGWVKLHKKKGSLGATVPGALLFGLGFALLGYCPGTSVGAVGHGALDALIGGVFGIMLGAGLYAAAYPKLAENVLHIGEFGDKTLIDVLKVGNPWLVIIPAAIIMIAFLIMLESLT